MEPRRWSKIKSWIRGIWEKSKAEDIRYLVAGDAALVMEFGNEISKEISARVSHAVRKIEEKKIPGIQELIPTYRSITILYDPLVLNFHELVKKLRPLEKGEVVERKHTYRLVEIPTLYGGEAGPDLGFVAQHAQLSEDQVMALHSERDYLVYMLGFTPGFPYLGGMNEKIATPRLASPRIKIPAGSVGIAGGQTGIYPSESPGGWQLIGRTPLKLYSPELDPPVFIRAGDYLRYVPISEEDYLRIEKEVTEGSYQVSIKSVSGGELRG